MTAYQTLAVTQDSFVTTLQLNRPAVRNAFNEQMMVDITAAVQAVNRSETRLVVLSANGSDFCSGADLNWMKAAEHLDQARARESSTSLLKMYSAIRQLPVPLLTRAFGNVFAGGVGLCAASDIVYADENAVFSISEARVGLIPAVMSPYVVERVGLARFRELTLTGRRFNATEAWRIGLVDQVLPANAADQAFRDSVQQILSNGPEALAATKELCRTLSRYDWEAEGSRLVEMIADRRCSAEGQEGLKAFFEKRPPSWKTEFSLEVKTEPK